MKKNIYTLCTTIVATILCINCSDSKAEISTPNITVSISPEKELIVDAESKEVSFDFATNPKDTELDFATSVSWIKEVDSKKNTWLIEENKKELSRNGRIYVLENLTKRRIDTIFVTQKSISGDINEPNVEFTEEEVPYSVPFAGNTFATYPEGSDAIHSHTGKFRSAWTDENVVVSSYFRVGGTGELKIGVVGNNPTGVSKIKFTIEGKSYYVTLNGAAKKLHGIATINKLKPGYVKVDIQGVSRTGKNFGEITEFKIGGDASHNTNSFLTTEWMGKDALNCYFGRRGASTHYWYSLPSGNIEYFYNEILITPENYVKSSYFMMNGFGEGYMGIQVDGNEKPKILFSVWSPYQTDNPQDIPEDKRIKLLRKGKNVTVGEFGAEGSGGQSWLNYDWKPGVVYKALVGVRPDGAGNTVYTAYFYADNEWKLIVSFSRPDTNKYYTGAYSFLENFDPKNSIATRAGRYGNQWVRTASGEWKEITEARFSYDGTAEAGMRSDVYGYVDEETNMFVLQGFGFFDNFLKSGSMLKRKATTGGAPNIDIKALEDIESEPIN